MWRTFFGTKPAAASFDVFKARGIGVSKYEDHQKRAADCLRMAHETTDRTNKAILLEMAQTWIRLAEQERARDSTDRE
jgi:hypothetical protein